MRKLTLGPSAVILLAALVFWLAWPRSIDAQRGNDQLVRIVSDDRLVNALIAAVNAQTNAIRGRTPGLTPPVGQIGDALKVWPVTPADPCDSSVKGDVAISQTASTRLVVGQPGQRIFVCAARVVAAAAEVPSFIEGTGTTCGTGPTAVSGSTTAANGESYAANGGFSSGNGGGSVMVTNKPGDDLCLQQSGANRLAGNIVYAFGR